MARSGGAFVVQHSGIEDDAGEGEVVEADVQQLRRRLGSVERFACALERLEVCRLQHVDTFLWRCGRCRDQPLPCRFFRGGELEFAVTKALKRIEPRCLVWFHSLQGFGGGE